MSFDLPGRPARAALLLMLALIVAIGACSRDRSVDSPATYTLLSDPAALDNALARCNQSSASVEEQECRNVRAALARLADERRKANSEQDRHAQAQAQIQFEEQRTVLRQQQEAERASQAREHEKTKVDPYSMPFIPPESPGKAQAAPDSVPAPDSAPAPGPAQDPQDPAIDAAATQVVASDLELTHQ
ncbi:MAG TPA: hypothetical protein VE046_09770 [Steroidobacteraceae bacterium]|nr:hypothetical protein [Steroidobacteraceae bacterium]